MVYKKYLLIAHYHKDGQIRSDLVNLIKLFSKSFEKIIFVSTKLSFSEKKKIKRFAYIITRPNYGYDFYSWKVGINFIQNKFYDDFDKRKILFLLPSSLLYLKPQKLLKEFNKIKNFENRVLCLSKSWEICEHIQSDLLIFSLNLLKQKKFLNWWNNIKKFKSRQIIIYKYEIGLSKFLDKQNIKTVPIFDENIKDFPTNLIRLLKLRVFNIFFKVRRIYKKNPTHFYWKSIYKKFGLIKIELIKSNPHNVEIRDFKKIFRGKNNSKLLLEAINN